MNRKFTLLLGLSIIIGTGSYCTDSQAAMCFLPDCQESSLGGRDNDRTPPPVASSECAQYKDKNGNPLFSAQEISAGYTCNTISNIVTGLDCYGECACDTDKYKWNSSNCSGNYVLSGSFCTDTLERATKCICNPDIFDQIPGQSGCVVPDASQGTCTDKENGTTYYKECEGSSCSLYPNAVDPGSTNCKWGCPSFVDANCEKCDPATCYTDDCHLPENSSLPLVTECPTTYGCKTVASDTCTSRCKECYTNGCHTVTDNRTDLGCQEWYPESVCPDTCKVGKTCSPRNCASEGYTMSSCPPNANCGTACTPGCGDNTPYYKYGTCNTNYIDLDTYWCDGAVKCVWDGTF